MSDCSVLEALLPSATLASKYVLPCHFAQQHTSRSLTCGWCVNNACCSTTHGYQMLTGAAAVSLVLFASIFTSTSMFKSMV